MLIFGHIGITTAVIKLYEKGTKKENNNSIDYRIVMVGSLLPDIIDKPLVQIIYGLQNHHGHFIAHSFIFSTLMIVLGICVFRMKNNKTILLLGICSLIHQIFDKMMLLPNVFFLPNIDFNHFIVLQKFEFIHNIIIPVYAKFPYLEDVVLYFEKPYVFISEIIGLSIIIYFIRKLYINKKYINFIKYGIL